MPQLRTRCVPTNRQTPGASPAPGVCIRVPCPADCRGAVQKTPVVGVTVTSALATHEHVGHARRAAVRRDARRHRPEVASSVSLTHGRTQSAENPANCMRSKAPRSTTRRRTIRGLCGASTLIAASPRPGNGQSCVNLAIIRRAKCVGIPVPEEDGLVQSETRAVIGRVRLADRTLAQLDQAGNALSQPRRTEDEREN